MPLISRLRSTHSIVANSVLRGVIPATEGVATSSSISTQHHAAGCGCAACSSTPQPHARSGMHTAAHSNSQTATSVACSPGCTCPRHPQRQVWGSTMGSRAFAEAAEKRKDKGSEEGGEEGKATGEEGGQQQQEEGAEQSAEELNAHELLEKLKASESSAQSASEQVEQLKDSLKRSLAEMENLRMRSVREIENAKKFAIQGFLKNILDVADNLERAYGAVPPDALSEEEGKTLDAARLRSLLKGMMGGVATTEKVFLQALRQQGVEQFNPEGEKFDPNFHSALFEMPDPSKEPGTIGQVTKRGYTLNERVIRPAEVGVVKEVEK